MAIRPAQHQRRSQRARWLLIAALSLPVSMPAQAMMDNMFGMMFRMMLVMMNVMSDTMLGNDNDLGSNMGGMNSLNMGMTALPMMSGFGSPMGMSPWNSFGSPMGMSPMGMSPMGMSPWNSFGSPMGMSPWNSGGGNPFTGGYPGRFPGGYGNPYKGGYGYPATYGAAPYRNASLLEGRWYGNSGEILEVHRDRFQLQTAGARVGGKLSIENNIVTLYSPQTNSVTRYTFLRNQSELLLNSGDGVVLTFRKRPANSPVRIF